MDNTKFESGAQLFTRLEHRPQLNGVHPIIFTNGGPFPKDFIQITGDASTGKTLLVTELLARCILPKTYKDTEFPGRNSSAILLSSDHHCTLFSLIHAIKAILRPFQLSSSDNQTILQESLKKLTILNCYSSEMTQYTLKNLERILSDQLDVSLLVIDSLSAHYWYDRQLNQVLSLNVYCASLIKGLKQILNERNVVTIFTKQEVDTCMEVLVKEVNFTIHLKKECDNFNAFLYDHDRNEHCKKSYKITKDFLEFFD